MTEKSRTTRPAPSQVNHVGIGGQINDHSAFLAGVPSKPFFTDAEIFTRTQVRVTEYYNLDTLSNFWDVYNVEAEALGQKIIYHPGGLPDIGRNLITRGNWGDAKSRDPERFFSQKMKCTPDSLSVSDPDLFELGPDRVRAYADKHKLFVTAGIDAALLCEGPVEAIVERIKFYIDTLARNGQCMIHLNQVPRETPCEHVHAAVAACHAYGRFPIPENLNDIHFEIPERESFSDFIKKA